MICSRNAVVWGEPKDAEYAYLRSGAVVGDRISLTTIESPLNGMKVRTQDDPEVDSDDEGQQRVAETDQN